MDPPDTGLQRESLVPDSELPPNVEASWASVAPICDLTAVGAASPQDAGHGAAPLNPFDHEVLNEPVHVDDTGSTAIPARTVPGRRILRGRSRLNAYQLACSRTFP
jgi:hypothetical protein